jgi:hypothetical protein
MCCPPLFLWLALFPGRREACSYGCGDGIELLDVEVKVGIGVIEGGVWGVGLMVTRRHASLMRRWMSRRKKKVGILEVLSL